MLPTTSNIKSPWLFVCFIPILLLGFVLYKNLINIPIGDDIYVMDMFNQLQESDSWREKLGILFSQHNEHRLVVTRLFALLQYGISGYIDLRSWIIIGNLSLIFIVVLFYLHIGDQKWWIVPIAFVIICPASNTLIAMQNSNLFSALFAVATIHFSLKEQDAKNSFLTFLASGLSIFSNSGGFALLAVISCVFFFQKRYRLLAFWFLWALLLVGSYYWSYEKIYRHPTSQLLFEQLPKATTFFFAFLGSIGFNPILAQITGVVFLVLSLVAIYRKYYWQNPFVFLCVMYCLLMAAMTTFKRYEYGINTALSERYSIYSMLLTGGVVVMIRDFFSRPLLLKRSVFPAILLLTILINLKYFTFHLRNPEGRKEGLMSKMENYQLNNSGFNCLEVSTLNKLTKNGFYNYHLDKPLHTKVYYDSLNRPDIQHITLRIDTAYQTQEDVHLSGTITNPPSEIEKINQTPHRLLVIHNNDLPFDCSRNELTQPQNNNALIIDMELENDRHQVRLPTFCFTLPKKHFLKGNYAIYFLFMNDSPLNHPPIKSNVVFHL